jgi:hypothetical protein
MDALHVGNPVCIGPVWFGILALGYRLTKSRELAVA